MLEVSQFPVQALFVFQDNWGSMTSLFLIFLFQIKYNQVEIALMMGFPSKPAHEILGNQIYLFRGHVQ